MPLLLLALVAIFCPAQAFCGFYVSGADASLYNNATLVVLMRQGTRTVLSMQNNYQGPPQDFAMVVPVPVVLQEDNVKVLPREIFSRVDALSAPRLVEYWEQDPCAPIPPPRPMLTSMTTGGRGAASPKSSAALGVTIEAQFEVGEYEVVILSAKDSAGLDTWLRQERYNIPAGAEAVLRGYVEAGTKFFVARVDAEKVRFEGGQAVLSPLRFHYDSADFSLPVRLGLLNSQGEQDLLVHILAPGQRYEVANYHNTFIPTNLPVLDSIKNGFGDFYDALFRRASDGKPTVVTEYAWASGSCDPCPTQPLSSQELATLGGDVIPGLSPFSTVLTRLHFRYTRETLAEDLVFVAAEPVIGGRGMPDAEGRLGEQGAAPSGQNQFQGRYVILHRWEGALSCPNPVRGRWGGPGGGASGSAATAGARLGGGPPPAPVRLSSSLAEDVPALGLVRTALAAEEDARAAAPQPAPLEPAPVEPEPTPAEPAPLQEAEAPPEGAAVESAPCATGPRAAGVSALGLALLALARRRGGPAGLPVRAPGGRLRA